MNALLNMLGGDAALLGDVVAVGGMLGVSAVLAGAALIAARGLKLDRVASRARRAFSRGVWATLLLAGSASVLLGAVPVASLTPWMWALAVVGACVGMGLAATSWTGQTSATEAQQGVNPGSASPMRQAA